MNQEIQLENNENRINLERETQQEKEKDLEENLEKNEINNDILEKSIENNKTDELCEIDFNLEEMPETETITLKQRDDVYYEMYREARRKAKIAKDLALSAFLEAKQIKNKYMLDDISDSDEDEFYFNEENK
jgi:hypothetical protein